MNNFIFLIYFSFQMLIFNTAAATNAAVNPILDIETAEKLVNEIYFKTLAQDIDYFNDNQIQTLQLISAQCPDDLGNIVYQARATYAYVANVDMLSKAGCASVNNMEAQPTTIEETTEKNSEVILYPNPAQTEINLHLLGFENVETQINIINMLGEQVLQIHNNIQNTMQININHLPTGVYVCQIKGKNIVVTKNFIITK